MDVEPTLANISKLLTDDFLELADPPLLARLVLKRRDGGGLVLLELLNATDLSRHVRLEDAVLGHHRVALLTDQDHGPDDLVLDEQGVEAEVGELLGEVVWGRHGDTTEVGNFFWRGLGGQGQVGGDHLVGIGPLEPVADVPPHLRV